MSTKLISLEAAGNASLVVPSSWSEAAITNNVIPLVVPLVKAIAATTGQVIQVCAKQYHETSLQLTFYDAVGREIETKVIPVMAKIEAVQLGLETLDKRGYHPKLREFAEKQFFKRIDED